jgi:hypothetical protein
MKPNTRKRKRCDIENKYLQRPNGDEDGHESSSSSNSAPPNHQIERRVPVAMPCEFFPQGNVLFFKAHVLFVKNDTRPQIKEVSRGIFLFFVVNENVQLEYCKIYSIWLLVEIVRFASNSPPTHIKS